MGLGLELLEVGEEAWGGDCARKASADPGVGDDTREGGLAGDLSTLVGEILGGGE